jgi:hypothetical protein
MYIYRKTASRGVSASRPSAESSHAEDLRDSDQAVEIHISPTPLSRDPLASPEADTSLHDDATTGKPCNPNLLQAGQPENSDWILVL